MDAEIALLLEKQNELFRKLKVCTARVDKYRHTFNEAPELVMLIEGNTGKISEINSICKEFTQYSPDELIGEHYSKLFVPLDDTSPDTQVENIKMYGDVVSSRTLVRKDGSVFPVDLTINTFNNAGEMLIVLFIRDISERVQAENEIEATNSLLEEANRTKDKFFTIISHDLKNLFGVLIGFSDLLKTDYDDLSENEKRFFIERIADISNNSYELLENLLEWARTQTGAIAFNPEVTNFCDIVKNSINLILPQADEKGIKLKNNCNGYVEVYADKNMLNSVIRNLISNGVKFSNSGGEVSISTFYQENKLYVEVEDNGIGIEDYEINSLFSLDRKTSSLGTANEKGTGLGLILCKEFVKRHGGDITVTSTPGKGSKFTFYILLS